MYEEGESVRYPELKVTMLKVLFRRQNGMGYWEPDCLELVKIDEEKVLKMLEQAGCKSLGTKCVCSSLNISLSRLCVCFKNTDIYTHT